MAHLRLGSLVIWIILGLCLTNAASLAALWILWIECRTLLHEIDMQEGIITNYQCQLVNQKKDQP